MEPKSKRRIILVACAGIVCCFLLFALQLCPDPESLTHLQKMIADKGWCSISLPGNDCVIHADIALIENDSLILKRKASTGDDSLVAVDMNSGFPAYAQSVSIRLIKEPNDILELTVHQPEFGPAHGDIKSGSLCIKFERDWSLAKWCNYIRWKVRNIGKWSNSGVEGTGHGRSPVPCVRRKLQNFRLTAAWYLIDNLL